MKLSFTVFLTTICAHSYLWIESITSSEQYLKQLMLEGTGSIHSLTDSICAPPSTLSLRVFISESVHHSWAASMSSKSTVDPHRLPFTLKFSYLNSEVIHSFLKDQKWHQVVRRNSQLGDFFFFYHQVGTTCKKENSINSSAPFVPCLGFLVDCEIPKFKTFLV